MPSPKGAHPISTPKIKYLDFSLFSQAFSRRSFFFIKEIQNPYEKKSENIKKSLKHLKF